jgi:16S rRNA (adenine1518-N6/adenine1519-N6)-dimethyltransferase
MAAKRGNPPVLKRFGQHFLVDQNALADIAAAVAPLPGETIIEIGPGRGALTEHLAQFDNPLIAVEIDRALAAQLREKYQNTPRVRVIEQDILKTDVSTIASANFVIAGNVPYYITTPIIFHVLKAPLPRHAVFLVQREVAERINAVPGSSEYGALSVNVQAIATAEIIRHVGPGAFRPPPKVDSSVIKITPRTNPLIDPSEADRFRSFVQGLFGQRRKQLANSLRSQAGKSPDEVRDILRGLAIDPRARPETLSPRQFINLYRGMA